MYNKLFTKILDSSIWLESNYTRIVWITLLATMDEDGLCQYAAPENVAQRAIVPVKKAEEALAVLSSPDKNSFDQENEGRRIERVPGGWIVLNCKKYKELANREMSKVQSRERVRRFREKDVTLCNAVKQNVTLSETESETESESLKPLVKPLFNLPLNDGTFYPVIDSDIATWTRLYPAVDVEQSMRNMIGWLNSNSTKRKTKRGIQRFINSWLSKEQDRPRVERNNGNGKRKGAFGALDEFRETAR